MTYLELRADLDGPEAGALRGIGARLPALAELRLGNGSRVRRLRDLGTSLARLRVLWLPRCGVQVRPPRPRGRRDAGPSGVGGRAGTRADGRAGARVGGRGRGPV